MTLPGANIGTATVKTVLENRIHFLCPNCSELIMLSNDISVLNVDTVTIDHPDCGWKREYDMVEESGEYFEVVNHSIITEW